MEIEFYFIAIIIFSAALRLLPHFFAPHGVGVDHWFWRAYIEEYRKNGVFPPVLPQFLLDIQQWYPPLFPLILSKLPQRFFDQYSHVLAVLIDLVRLSLLMFAAYLVTGRTNSMVAAGLIYSLTPILISSNTQLNPRGLGALFLDLTVLLLIWLVWHDAAVWFWGLVALISGLILLTHKMTTQLFWFSSILAGIVFMDWRLLMLVPVSIGSALIISRGFYIKVLKAHWDIVSFYYKHWKWGSAHPVRESPIYGEPKYETSTKFFRSGFSGFVYTMQYLFGFNPWGWVVLVASLLVYGPSTNLTAEDLWMIQWLGLTLLFIILTTFVPSMRCLGRGYMYNYNAAFPASLLVAMIWGGHKHTHLVNLLLAITLLACLAGIIFYLWKLKHSKTLKVDSDMEVIIGHLQKSLDGVVLCLPNHWDDLIAYRTNHKVLAGGHGYGFKLLEQIFPRILRPIAEIIGEYKVKYLLTIDGYLPDNFIKELSTSSVTSFGIYRLYVLN
jgi:hypothetical protein